MDATTVPKDLRDVYEAIGRELTSRANVVPS